MKTISEKTYYLLCALILNVFIVNAQVITIGSTGDYLTLEAASNFIVAGDSVIVQNEVFSDGSQYLGDLIGTELDPIVIIAETEHSAIFQGGSQAIHLSSCKYVELNGFIFEQQTSNGVNIDDGGNYTVPSKHITVRNCIFRDIPGGGNNDLLKMSGIDSFLIENCQFIDGSGGGSGIDFVGCHYGTVQDCEFDEAGSSGVQIKGGSQFIKVQRNMFKDLGQRAVNLGGNTDLIYFRPPLPDPIVGAFEAADIDVFSNIFIGTWSPIAYVGSVRVKVVNNTIYKPENWVIRILQETTEPGFLPCSDNEFRNNIVYQETDLTEVNVGNNTSPSTFIFTNNVWYNEASSSWTPGLPVVDTNQVIGDPLFVDDTNEDFQLMNTSPAIEAGKVLSEPSTDFIKVNFYSPPSSGAYEGNDLALPIEVVKPLQAIVLSNAVQLIWNTISEINNQGFEMQRSQDRESWTKVGWIEGHNNSTDMYKYNFVDKKPIEGNSYYRYKQLDFDGLFEYSPVVNADFNSRISYVYPNPSSDFVIVKTSNPQIESNIKIYDLTGKIVLRTKLTNSKIDISSIQKGVYFLTVDQGVKGMHYHKVIIE